MITAVQNLPQATENVRSLFLTRDLHSLVKQTTTKRSFTSSFTLDPSQKKALDKAVHSSFTIIEGQPGSYVAHSCLVKQNDEVINEHPLHLTNGK